MGEGASLAGRSSRRSEGWSKVERERPEKMGVVLKRSDCN